MKSSKTVLVTGAGGFIGGWLTETFHLSGCMNVRAGVRRWGSGARLARFGIPMVHCDIDDRASVARACDGVDYVVHCAMGDPSAVAAGVENVIGAALDAGVQRVVYLSSISVYGNRVGVVGEDAPLAPTDNAYADSKISGETACGELAARGAPVVILRPTIVYGPFSKTWTETLGQRLATGRWQTLRRVGEAEGRCNLLYVSDLVEAVRRALTASDVVGEAFNVSGPEIVSWNDYWQQFNTQLGLPELQEASPLVFYSRSVALAPVRKVGSFALAHYRRRLKAVAQSSAQADRFMRMTKSAVQAMPTAAELALYRLDAVYSTSKARDRLGFVPAVSLDEGLSLTAAWARHHELVQA